MVVLFKTCSIMSHGLSELGSFINVFGYISGGASQTVLKTHCVNLG